uniref:Peptidase M16 N-terminal domain-containing protein n=1 Tax=Odontella aurita TaxID=265563 RepID=A0A7S4IA98_9STRA|mmetsp:Transcript_22085/g.65437  ORF Transcript_22085/g.65437 Transcript_22085/m.65437 type:complete len:319 (+) Transcript_22085:602-1558(+)
MVPPNSNECGGGTDGASGPSPSRVDSASSSDVDDGGVIIGPDLNPTRSTLDRKVYRQIILKNNGLRAVLISDTVAMGQKEEHGTFGGDDSGYDSESSSVIEDTEGQHDENAEGNMDLEIEEEEEEEDAVFDLDEDSNYDDDNGHGGAEGIRHAAAALAVGVGSYHDPGSVQGIAHFLEHMLFMGTEKYPTENAYDSFLSRVGGSNNAYTEMEHTLYHFEVPQEKLWESLDMFAQFFVSPLLLKEAAGRELNAIESEFQLSKNADDCRLQQVQCHTGKRKEDHPFGNFSWGNMKSLKEDPESNGVDVMAELRKFYEQVR